MKRVISIVLVLALLVVLGNTILWGRRAPRTPYEAEIFQGVTYQRQVHSNPRPLLVHVIEVDLTAPGVGFLVTPEDKRSHMDLSARTTSDFLTEFDVQVAINGSFFKPFHSRTYWDYYPHSGDPVDVLGLAISGGETYSDDSRWLPALCLRPGRAEISRNGCPPNTLHALAGDPLLVEQGAVAIRQRPPDPADFHPRTAVGVDAQGQTLWLVVVDGRQSGYSEGATLAELADIVAAIGVDTALNLDGGGSSTLVMAEPDGPRILNAPFHTRIPMRQRPVASHLGVFALPLN